MTGRPITPLMRRMLENVADGVPYNDHCRGRSEFGGANMTRAGLMARGLLTENFELTPAGRDAIGRNTPAGLNPGP